jgi:Flp pilus assembly protein TadD
MDQQVKAQPAAEAQMKAQIAQLGEQLKAAQAENKKELSQLAHSVTSQGEAPATAASQPSPNSEAYDKQLQEAVQQLNSNDLPGTMKTCAALIQLDSKRWEGYALAGRALNAANKRDQARNFLLKAQQLAPTDIKPQIQQMIDNIGSPGE